MKRSWAGIDVDGSLLAGPSNSKSEVVKELGRWGDASGIRVVRLVEHEPAVDAVVRAALNAVASRMRVSWGGRELDALGKAVERLERKRATPYGRKATTPGPLPAPARSRR